MSEKRFVQLGDTHIKDTITGEEWYAPCEYSLLDLLNEQQSIIEQLQEENKGLKHWKKRIIDYLTDWFNKTEYLTVLYKINEIRTEIGLDNDE